MMGIQSQFAQTAFSLAKRYQRLNMAIESAFSLSKSKYIFKLLLFVVYYSNIIRLGKVMQIIKDKNTNLEKADVSLPGVNAAKLLTVSCAVQDEHKSASTLGTAIAPSAANCEYE